MQNPPPIEDVTPDELAQVIQDYHNAGASNVTTTKQADGNYTVQATFPDVGLSNLTFDLPEPQASDLGSQVTLWGTYYYGQPAVETPGGIVLRNQQDQQVGPAISQKDWCLGAMEGTIIVTQADGSVVTFNYDGTGSSPAASCETYFPSVSPSIVSATERARFQRARGTYGDGVAGYSLCPFRTLAVDQNNGPVNIGAGIYIPQARGVVLTLPDGSNATHDGYFFAADTGGLIKLNHVDFFLGIVTANPFPFVQSSQANTFAAQIVTNGNITASLAAMHK